MRVHLKVIGWAVDPTFDGQAHLGIMNRSIQEIDSRTQQFTPSCRCPHVCATWRIYNSPALSDFTEGRSCWPVICNLRCPGMSWPLAAGEARFGKMSKLELAR